MMHPKTQAVTPRALSRQPSGLFTSTVSDADAAHSMAQSAKCASNSARVTGSSGAVIAGTTRQRAKAVKAHPTQRRIVAT
jgi:hypothetical protein